MWDDAEEDSFFNSINWDVQEAQATQARQHHLAQGGHNERHAVTATLPKHADNQHTYATRQLLIPETTRGSQQPQAGLPPGGSLRSLFLGGPDRGLVQPQQAQHSGPPSNESGAQQLRQATCNHHYTAGQRSEGTGKDPPHAYSHTPYQPLASTHAPPWHPQPHEPPPSFSVSGSSAPGAAAAGGRGGQSPSAFDPGNIHPHGPTSPQGPAHPVTHHHMYPPGQAQQGQVGPAGGPAWIEGPCGRPSPAWGHGAVQQAQHGSVGGVPAAEGREGQPPAAASGGSHPAPPGTASHPPRQAQQAQQAPSGGLGPLMHGELTLGADRRLQLKLGHHDVVKAALHRLNCEWDTSCRAWRFPISDHNRVLEALQRVKGVRVRVEPLHPVPMAVIQSSLGAPDDSDRYRHIPTSLETQLMPFQREGVRFALKHGGRALVGDEMGLGKTVQAIAVAAAYRDEWPALIIAPSSLREQWADALHRWLGITEDQVHVVHSNKDAARVPPGLKFLITSYNFVPKMDLEKRYQVIILDESHYIKDHQAQRTKATVPLLKSARRVILLTGTPALNKPKEIFQQLAALVPGAKLTMKQFGERYCTGSRFDKYGGACNLPELNALLKGTVMVRRLKKDVLTQLPKKRRQQVFLTLDSEAKRELQSLQSQLDAVKAMLGALQRQQVASGGAAPVGAGSGRMEENKAIMEMYRKTADLKCCAVEEYVQLLLEGGQKFLLFAHHTCLLDAVEHSCNRKKAKYIRIDGKTAAADRQKLVNRFQEQEDVKVAILSIRAAGVGLTLTAASTVVFAEMSWTPGEIIQAEDRAHRIGQASSVNVYFLHVRNSIDEIIWTSVQNKLENVGQALDGQDQSMEVSGVRHMPERGQRALDTFLSQGQAPVPGQQAAAGGVRNISPSKSPTKHQQSTLHSFFNNNPRQARPPASSVAQQAHQQGWEQGGHPQQPAALPQQQEGRLPPAAGSFPPGAAPPFHAALPTGSTAVRGAPGAEAGCAAPSLAPLREPSALTNAPRHPSHPQPQQLHHQHGQHPMPGSREDSWREGGDPGGGGVPGPGNHGKWETFVDESRCGGASGGGESRWGQENRLTAGDTCIGEVEPGEGRGDMGCGAYRQMAGAKRSYLAMMQQQTHQQQK